MGSAVLNLGCRPFVLALPSRLLQKCHVPRSIQHLLFLVAYTLRMARHVAARLARLMSVRMRTFCSSCRVFNVVEKLASAMMAEREKLLENMHVTNVPAQRIKDLEAVHKAWNVWKEQVQSLQETEKLFETEKDKDMLEMAESELASVREETEARYEALKRQILANTRSIKSKGAIMELKQGVGGQESCLFLGEMLRMYMKFCETRAQRALEENDESMLGAGWSTELLAATPADVSTTSGSGDAFKEAILQVHGPNAFEALRFEAGVHRVQRIPATQNLGKLQTSTMAIIVLPMQEENDAKDIIDPKDVRIETMRARGSGGQHVNRTESAVRLTHDPSGITVSMQDSRSQHQNRTKAWEVLRARLLDQHLQKEASENRAMRRSQVASADRSERVRTYNFPQDRVTDHRIGVSLSDIQGFMDGDDSSGTGLAYLIEELMTKEDDMHLHALLQSQETT